MSVTTQIKLAQTRKGRVILHLAALIRDAKFAWHYQGIMREIRHI